MQEGRSGQEGPLALLQEEEGSPIGSWGILPFARTPMRFSALGQAAGTAFPPTRVEVLVLRADDLAPFGGVGVRADVVPFDPIRGWLAPVAASAGQAGTDGRWVTDIGPLPPASIIRISAEIPGSQSKDVMPGGPRTVTLIVCPPGIASVVCEVAERRAYFSDVLAQTEAAWGGPSSFAADQAHAAVENFRPRDPRLLRHWAGELSWALADPVILPRDWPALITNYEQALAVFDEIPFPDIEDTDWFRRCAFGTPVWRGKDGAPLSLANFRIYVPDMSDFFPRTDRAIRTELAARYLVNIATIIDCIDHKLGKRLREVTRMARAMSTMGLAVSFMLGPIAGATGIGNSIVDLATYAYRNLGVRSAEIQAGGNALADGVLSGGQPGIDLAISAGLSAIVARLARDADPRVAGVAQQAIPTAVNAIAGDAGSGVLSSGAADFATLQSAGSAALVFAIRLLVGSINAVGARSAEEFKEIALGMRDLPNDVVAFLLWCTDQLLLDALYRAAEEELARSAAVTGNVLSIDPTTGAVLRNGRPTSLEVDPRTGFVFDPETQAILDPRTGEPTGAIRDPETGRALGPDGTPIDEDRTRDWAIPEVPPVASRLSGIGAPAGAALLATLVAAGIIVS